ncbi:SDR family NAD(P)-dependent oxidoreductase [Labrys wisconsinensis]|uniref:NAD(P)-dependent dehydrogenase (Short-subunit alcohol dehydrogenase family) n=1 Tax=Labrys wisconsinensis TaxID=425677 RepID=A0ABU0J6R8_9HYPH|nr:SDR family oxidoreductase [Labrys wisconsinensis]MDQ0468887.1 NAD(P)-dependent dehydrogenase (short-subunit alcohol dehydrogenase family) [Labrys wisconsinensis]
MTNPAPTSGGRARRALVTGVSSGIGEAIAGHLLDQGWQVVGFSRRAPAFAHERLRHVPVDLFDRAALGEALARIEPVEAIVHAAGMLRVGMVGGLDPENGRAMWRLHVDAAEQIVEALASRLPDGARIVLIGSRTAAGSAGRAQYAATKAALVGMARSFAIELAPRRIAVNVVAPGATDTPMLKDPERAAVAPKLPPMGRLVRPEEVAALTAFLLSGPAGSITGQQIVICGGASL